MWDDYHVFLIATLVFTRLLLDEIYHLIELPFEWFIDDAMFVCLLDELILGFCYSDLTLETGGFELALTITLVLQANRLTKCASHPTCWNGHVTLLVGVDQSKLPSCKVWWSYPLCYWGYNDFSLSHGLARPRDQKVMWFYGWETLMVVTTRAKFGGRRHVVVVN